MAATLVAAAGLRCAPGRDGDAASKGEARTRDLVLAREPDRVGVDVGAGDRSCDLRAMYDGAAGDVCGRATLRARDPAPPSASKRNARAARTGDPTMAVPWPLPLSLHEAPLAGGQRKGDPSSDLPLDSNRFFILCNSCGPSSSRGKPDCALSGAWPRASNALSGMRRCRRALCRMRTRETPIFTGE